MDDLLLNIQGISCGYNGTPIVDDLSFHILEGDIASLLGPSGCGKTTILRAIAGFEPINTGVIELNGTVLSSARHRVAPEQRQVGMVFQDYALFPHLTVYHNIAFGIPRDRPQGATVEHLLQLVKLPGLGARYPHELSGGQQQRVALARALAAQPRILLLDEPFSNLDVDLRRSLSQEVRDILQDQGISAILVTHDQEEAFSFSDKVGVLRQGELQQWDTPYELYHEPANKFVANFIGQGHFIPGAALDSERINTEVGILTGNRAWPWPTGTPVELLLRLDDVVEDADSAIRATIIRKTFMGATTQYKLRLRTGSILEALIPSHQDFNLDDEIGIRIDAEHLVVFKATE
jgi:iron(III) transport system ATP-binding protein